MTNITTVENTANNLANLESKKQAIIKATTNQNTKKTYQNALNLYGKFCIINNIENTVFTKTITEKTLTDFITYLETATWQRKRKDGSIYQSGTYSYKTIESFTYAINTIQAEQKDKDGKPLVKPVTNLVKKFLVRIKKLQNQTPNQAEALQYEDLIWTVRNMDLTTNQGKRDKALLLVGFFGCLRRSEISTLQLTDTTDASGFVTFDNDGMYITLKKHKTDTHGEPITKYIKKRDFEKDCPVVALKNWIETLEKETGNIFVTVHKSGSILENNPLSTKTVGNIVKNHFGYLYSGHSLRVGFAVAAKDRGATLESIQTHGGWKSATMPMHYTKQQDTKKNSATNVF